MNAMLSLHDNGSYAKAAQCYVLPTLSILFSGVTDP